MAVMLIGAVVDDIILNMKINKERLLLLTLFLAILFFASIFVLVVFYSFTTKAPSLNGAFPTPTIVPVKIANDQTQQLRYDLDGQQKLLKFISSPKTLSPQDLVVKRRLAKLLIMGSDVVYSLKDVEIDYLRNSDLFQGKILSKNVDLAKQEAVTWLKQQGLSQTGVCNLPFMFYIDPNIVGGFHEVIFNPLPPGC
jgi:preprotein translocase subunit SecG